MHTNLNFILSLLAVLIASTHSRNVPKVLQKINKALGLPKKSEVLWDILSISGINTKVEENVADIANNTNEITNLKETVDQLEECCNCTKQKLLLVATGTMVNATGEPGAGSNIGATNHSQVMDINSPNSCTNLQQYPHAISRHGAGGVLNGHPVICGGRENLGTALSSCYKHEHSINEWTLFGNLNTGRNYHASTTLLNGDLWMTGGWNDGSPLASTEIVRKNGTISVGTPLPAARSGHCMVTLHDGKVMVIGAGWPTSLSKSTLIYNPLDNSFTAGPELAYQLRGGTCTIFNSPAHGNRPVVFAGGRFLKAQLLDYTLGNTWVFISDLPNSIVWGGAVALPTLTGDGVILQHEQYFYELICDASTCNWEILEKELSLPVREAVTMYLPAEYTCV